MAITRHRGFGLDWYPERLRHLLDFDFEFGESFKIEELRDGDDFVVRAEIPGIDPEKDAELTVSDGMLHVAVHRTQHSEQKSKDGYRSEFRYGEMLRDVLLPAGIDETAIKAEYKDGILEVRMPVTMEVKPPVTRIPVTHG
jgi:HSP20 family protein